MNTLSLWWVFLKQQLKELIEYKQDFLMGMVSVLFQQVGLFLVTVVVFTQLKELGGFSINEMFLLYGFYTLVRGIDHFYNDNIWSFAWNKVKDGRFITILLRPINPILHVVIERFNMSGLSEILVGILIIIYSKIKIGFSLNITQWLILLVILLCGVSVYFSVKLLFSAPAFWTICCGEFMTAGYEISNSAKYPVGIYKNKIIKSVLLYVLPFPITAYLPTVYCLDKVDNLREIFGMASISINSMIIYCVLISLILLFIAIKVWNLGLKRYEPTGT